MTRANRKTCPVLFLLLFPLLLLLPCSVEAATVAGFVYDAENGEALPYANVFFRNAPWGDMANRKGYYVIPALPAGEYEIVFGYMGYRQEVRTITLAENEEMTISVELQPQAIQMATVEVNETASDLALETGKLYLATRDLTHMPAPVEADVFRAVQMLPGVSTLSDYSSGLYVRGGSADQNLILLDDMDVYNPDHLFGFFSTFNVDAVKTVELQKGGFPAQHGGRLSSVLDVQNRDGNRREIEGVARLSLISASATVEGPWKRGSWMVSGRQTFIEQLARLSDIDLPYEFYDLHAKGNYDFAENDRSSVSYYRGRDRLDWNQENLDILLEWGNDTWSTQWTHLFSSRVFSHLLIGGSRFQTIAEVEFDDFKVSTENKITDVCAKWGLSYRPNRSHLIDFGAEVKALNFSYVDRIGKESGSELKYDGVYGALYAQDEWMLSPIWSAEAGLRLNYYTEGEYFRLSPRLSLRRQIREYVSAHARYGRYSQFLNLVAFEGASFASMWFPVDKTLDPGIADHYILGVEFGPYRHISLSIEGYYKPYDNVVEFSEEYQRSLGDNDPDMCRLFNSGTGEAYGVDVHLRNQVSRFTGWIGYAYGYSRRTIKDYNFGREYAPTYDRRHQVYVVQDISVGYGLSLNAIFRYGSGQPVTLASGRYTIHDITGREYETPLYGDINTGRLPSYHRLDLGISKRKRVAGMDMEFGLQVINAYNRKNVYIREYDMEKNPAEYRDVTMLPILPTISVSARF